DKVFLRKQPAPVQRGKASAIYCNPFQETVGSSPADYSVYWRRTSGSNAIINIPAINKCRKVSLLSLIRKNEVRSAAEVCNLDQNHVPSPRNNICPVEFPMKSKSRCSATRSAIFGVFPLSPF